MLFPRPHCELPYDTQFCLTNIGREGSLVDGIVRDGQIKEVVVDKFEPTTTILAVGIPVVVIGLILIIEPKVGGSLWTMHGKML